MALIRIDYDGLAQQSSALKNHASTYESLCASMKDVATGVSDTWTGEAASAFTELMAQYLQQGSIISEIIQTIQGYADTTSNSFQNVDQECATLIRNSF
jgi:WXG100 family type VII secretion target